MRHSILFLIALTCFGQEDFKGLLSQIEKNGIEKAASGTVDAYSTGVELALLKPSVSIDWFSYFYKTGKDPLYLVGKAYALLQSGERKESRDMLEDVLDKLSAENLTFARAHYILGLNLITLEPESAKQHFQESAKVFRKLGHHGEFKAYCVLAEISISQDAPEECEAYIAQALRYIETKDENLSRGRLYELQSEVSWNKKDWQNSLEYAQRSKRHFFRQGDFTEAWIVLARVGFLLVKTGDIRGAESVADDLAYITQSNQNQWLRASYLILRIYLNKCKKEPYSIHKAELESWDGYKGSVFVGLLAEIEETACE